VLCAILKVLFETILPPIVFPIIAGAVAGELTGGDAQGAKAGLEAGILLSSIFIASVYSPILVSTEYSSIALTLSPGYAIVTAIVFSIFGFVAGYLGGTVRDYLLPYT
jgi:predicted Na+-dependent transporter